MIWNHTCTRANPIQSKHVLSSYDEVWHMRKCRTVMYFPVRLFTRQPSVVPMHATLRSVIKAETKRGSKGYSAETCPQIPFNLCLIEMNKINWDNPPVCHSHVGCTFTHLTIVFGKIFVDMELQTFSVVNRKRKSASFSFDWFIFS